MMKKLVFLLLVISFNSLASEDKWIKVTLGGFVSSQRIFRGAVFYPDSTAFAGPSFTLWEKLQVRGPNLIWQEGKRDDPIQYSFGIQPIRDGAPFLTFNNKFDEDNDYRASRPDSLEVNFDYKYKFGYRNGFAFGLFYAKEVHRHKGEFLSFSFTAPVYKFTSVEYAAGYGTKQHNQYAYGTNAASGSANQTLSLRYSYPKVSWKGLIIFDITGSWVQQNGNREANLVRGEHNQVVTSFMALWFI